MIKAPAIPAPVGVVDLNSSFFGAQRIAGSTARGLTRGESLVPIDVLRNDEPSCSCLSEDLSQLGLFDRTGLLSWNWDL